MTQVDPRGTLGGRDSMQFNVFADERFFTDVIRVIAM